MPGAGRTSSEDHRAQGSPRMGPSAGSGADISKLRALCRSDPLFLLQTAPSSPELFWYLKSVFKPEI